MSKVYADAVTATEANQDLTLGGSGDNVIVTAGATLKTNTVKDSGGNTIWTSDGSGTLSSVNSAFAPSNMLLLSTQTASNAASLSFTSSITGAFTTYKLYIFKFYDVNPVTDGTELTFQASIDGGSNYNTSITSTWFRAYHMEADDGNAISYIPSGDQDEGTAYQRLIDVVGSAADESAAGELFLFNPSSTTYVKHFYGDFNCSGSSAQSQRAWVAGYVNVAASDVDAVQFKMSSGNMDAVIQLYGMS